MRARLLPMLRCWCLMVVCLSGFFVGEAALAQEASESQVKAAFLYKFTGYVEWPEGAFQLPDSPLVIGVVNADDVLLALTRMIAGRRVGSRPLVARGIDTGESAGIAPAALNGVHVLFVGNGDNARLGKVLTATKGRAILTVADSGDALQLGSVINFLVVDQQMRFQVSLPAATQGSLKISSRLLSVAHQVITEP